MGIDVNVEPFEIKVGFREIEFFNLLNKNVQEFLTVINEKTEDINDLIRDTEQDIDRKLMEIKKKEQKEKSQNNKTNTSGGYIQIKKEE